MIQIARSVATWPLELRKSKMPLTMWNETWLWGSSCSCCVLIQSYSRIYLPHELGVSWKQMGMIAPATWTPVILRTCFAWARGITQMSSRSMVTWRIDIPGLWERVGSPLECNFSQDLLFFRFCRVFDTYMDFSTRSVRMMSPCCFPHQLAACSMLIVLH